MTTVYGIRNCDTIKKTLKWLDKEQLEHAFHDYKKTGIDSKTLKQWCQQVSWEDLVNRRGTTWRKLPESERDGLNQSKAIKLMIENPSLIKRPVIAHDDHLIVGFDEAELTKLLSRA